MQVTTCPSCSAQYNTAHMQSGAQFQCANCGAMVLVQAAAPVQQPQRQYQQPAQPQAPQPQQVQRRSSMAPAGGQARGGMPNARRGAGRAPAGRAPSGNYQQGGYQQQGFEQPQMGFPPPKKKSNTGLIIGIIGGSMAILILVIVLATTGGTTMSSDDMQVITAVNSWEAGQPLPSDETIKRAMDIRTAKNFPDELTERTFNTKLGDIQQTKDNQVATKFNEKFRKDKADARIAVSQVANEFTEALQNQNADAIKNLVDWNQFYAYLTFNGQDASIQKNFPKPGEGEEYYSPSSHELKYEVLPKLDANGQPVLDKDGSPANVYKITSHTLFDIATMQDKGIKYILKMYGNKKIQAIHDIDKDTGEIKIKGMPDIEGAPTSGMPKSKFFYGDVTYTNGKGAHYDIGNEDLRIFIGGRWGESTAKIVAIYDRTTKQWLTRIRDDAYNATVGNTGEGGDTFRSLKDRATNKTGDASTTNDNGSTANDHPATPNERYNDGITVAKTGVQMDAGPLRALLEDAIKNQSNIANDSKNFDAFSNASKKAQIDAFGFICDTILSVQIFADDAQKKLIVPKLWEFFGGLIREHKLDDLLSPQWQDFLDADRDTNTSYLEFAWRCGQLYEAYKGRY